MKTTTKPEPIDRTGWAQGPWDFEPDRISWATRQGHPGMVMRAPSTGALCGYVGIPQGHPLYGKATNEIRLAQHAITYAGETPQNQKGSRTGHWWFGFHNAHGGQYAPVVAAALDGIAARQPAANDQYADIGTVIHGVEMLARDIAEIAAHAATETV